MTYASKAKALGEETLFRKLTVKEGKGRSSLGGWALGPKAVAVFRLSAHQSKRKKSKGKRRGHVRLGKGSTGGRIAAVLMAGLRGAHPFAFPCPMGRRRFMTGWGRRRLGNPRTLWRRRR